MKNVTSGALQASSRGVHPSVAPFSNVVFFQNSVGMVTFEIEKPAAYLNALKGEELSRSLRINDSVVGSLSVLRAAAAKE